MLKISCMVSESAYIFVWLYRWAAFLLTIHGFNCAQESI